MSKPNLKVVGEPFSPTFGKRGELRQKVGKTGRVHMDRWLPFIVINRSDEPNRSIARRIARNCPAYLVWSKEDDREASEALDVLLGALGKVAEKVLVIELCDQPLEPRPDDSPELPPFRFLVEASKGDRAGAALEALSAAVSGIEVDLRQPELAVARPDDGSEETDRLRIDLPQIHRAPDGSLYPQLTHALVLKMVDAVLRAAAAYIKSAGNKPKFHHLSLGRSAVLAAALKADRRLAAIAGSYDFLLSLSPINATEAMADFVAGGEDKAPVFRYRPLTVDPDLAKRKLYGIDLSVLEDPVLERLLCEKRRETDVQLTLLAHRNSPDFRSASALLYGVVTPGLLADARSILDKVANKALRCDRIGARDVAAAANRLVDRYRAIDPRFEARIEVRDDVSGLLVSGKRLMISSMTAMAESRLDALLSHEVSVHLLTFFNGATQKLRIFSTGLADYEGVQEGLGVFAEWLVGGLTANRLRLLAGRVVAVDAMLGGAGFIDIYRLLTRDHGFGRKSAFDISMRVTRSGGFAKDAIYLKGFRHVVKRVATGDGLDAFWLGKIAPDHVDVVEELLLRGLLHPPVFVPEFMSRPEAQRRIEKLRAGLPFDRLLDLE